MSNDKVAATFHGAGSYRPTGIEVEAAAAELVRQQSGGMCEIDRTCRACDCFGKDDTDKYARDHARAALIAAHEARIAARNQ